MASEYTFSPFGSMHNPPQLNSEYHAAPRGRSALQKCWNDVWTQRRPQPILPLQLRSLATQFRASLRSLKARHFLHSQSCSYYAFENIRISFHLLVLLVHRSRLNSCPTDITCHNKLCKATMFMLLFNLVFVVHFRLGPKIQFPT